MSGLEGLNLYAVIVAYFPEEHALSCLVRSLTSQGCKGVVVFQNSLLSSTFLDEHTAECVFLGEGKNLGLGAAINQSFDYLKTKGADAVFTFDQDSSLHDGFVQHMRDMYQGLIDKHVPFSAVVPKIVDRRSTSFEYMLPEVQQNDLPQDLKFLRVGLQSGMLINCEMWQENKFDDGLFIEYVDTEWCYRLGYEGKYLCLAEKAIMYHEVSDELPRKVLGFYFLKYSPIRRYYFFRNSIFLLRQKYVPIYFKIRILTAFGNRIVSMIFFSDDRRRSFTMTMKGILHGLGSVKGPLL
ncbi:MULTISPECIES: glycosyltransferase family 2 protein [Pseudomonas aeruginosa group]|uniref:glycosyltransferase family 2 protein n=1 Tax=Pseudomonas aeruginosa group TaxID=136841 RepID=UPI00129876A0|nr:MULTISPECIES: glycosyltransferase family 2 protein [Pseudomonas aeruginosa group]MDK2351315.1 glycosyltransferase family 2 protein [Pseudomonas paraeruginosa]MEA8483534.1 glycosyltransferase family 2 protein [Pseudomonas aeruginosa]